MPVLVRFRPGADAAARLIGLPMTAVEGRGFLVREPMGWNERELTSRIVQRAGPYVASISSVQVAAPRVGGCNCMGRRA